MRKRLRKKLRLEEFRELGFEVQFRLLDGWTEPELDRFWDVFIADAVEREGLICGGGCGRTWDITVMRPHRGSATEADRSKLSQWLAQHPGVRDARVGPLVDMWHAA